MGYTILACSPHPDDVESYAGGILLKQVQTSKIVIIDVTDNHSASNFSNIDRTEIADHIAKKYGFYARENIGIDDGKVNRNDIEQQEKIIKLICKYKPDIILLPYSNTDHSDHIEAKELFERAIFKAGISNELTNFNCHYVKNVFYYLMEKFCEPNILVDIGPFFNKKIEMLMEYSDQFCLDENKRKTNLNTNHISNIKYMNAFLGNKLNAEYAEGLVIKSCVVVENLFELYLQSL